jgi:hypothetical protein
MNFRALSLPALILIIAFAAVAVSGLRGAYGAQPIEGQARDRGLKASPTCSKAPSFQNAKPTRPKP